MLNKEQPDNTREKGELVGSVIINTLFFKVEGFFCDEIGWHQSKVTGPTLRITMTNILLKRRIYFSFSSSSRDILVVGIFRLPYEDQSDFISFNLLVKKRVPLFNEEMFEFSFYNGSFKEKAEQLVSMYTQLMEKYALNIIRGEHWEEFLFPDWTK